MICVLLAGCMDSFESAPTESDVEVKPYNITIEELHNITTDSGEITSDLWVCGSVTANDCSGNFYRSFMLEQDGFAVEVLEGSINLASRYPEGAVVTISLEGLWYARSCGVLQIGVEASESSSYDLDYMPHTAIVDQHIWVSSIIAPVTPLVIDLIALKSSSLLSSTYGRLVQINDVALSADDSAIWSGTNTFVDSNGIEFDCYTTTYCDYANETIPTGNASIIGILQSNYYGTGNPCIKMRSQSDYLSE